MKKFIVIGLLILASTAFCGEIRTLPQSIQLHSPTTNTVEFVSVEFMLDNSNPYAVLTYRVIDAESRLHKEHLVYVRNLPDNPETPGNEATTTFTDFVAGFGTTLKSRADALAWSDIRNHYALVP